MKVSEIMTKGVECISPKTTLKDAAVRMRALDVGFLPILDKDRLLGTITDRDLAIRGIGEGRDPLKTKVNEIMTSEVFYCSEDEDVEDCARSMAEKEVRRMLILDAEKRLVGVVSIGDIAIANVDERVTADTLRDIAEAA